MTLATEKSHPSELWKGYWGIQVLQIGQSLELFESLTEAKTPTELSQERSLELRYTKLWCEAAANFDFLHQTGEKFQTPPEFREWLLRSKGFTQSHLHLSRRINETMTAVFSGRALPEPPVSLRLLLQENLQSNYQWLFQETSQISTRFDAILNAESRILEVGCGLGFGLSHLRAYYPQLELFGLESDYECAQETERSTKAVIHIGDSPGGRFSQDFDLILCFRALSASPRPQTLLSDCAKLLKPGGLFLLGSESNDDSEKRKCPARRMGEQLAYNILAGESIINSFSRQDLRNILSESGFKVEAEVDAPDWATPAFLCSAD